jgi:hypothetical protein
MVARRVLLLGSRITVDLPVWCLGGMLFFIALNAGLVAAQEDLRDRDRNRRTDRSTQQTEDRRQRLPERQPQLVPPRPGPPERFDQWILGVSVTNEDTGALITYVERDSAAWEAGLERRDQIVAVAGYQVGFVSGQLYPLERELHLRADRRGNVRLLVQNHRNQRLVNIDVRMRRAGRPDDRERPDRPERPGFITGTVDSRLAGQIPRNSVLVVRLIDTSSRISTLKPIAQTSIRDPGPFPVPFELSYETDQIEAGREYALHAVLSVNGLAAQRTRDGQVVDFADRPLRYQLMLDRR